MYYLEQISGSNGPIAVAAVDAGGAGGAECFERFGQTDAIACAHLHMFEKFNAQAKVPGGVEAAVGVSVFKALFRGEECEARTRGEVGADDVVDNRNVHFPLEVEGNVDVAAVVRMSLFP